MSLPVTQQPARRAGRSSDDGGGGGGRARFYCAFEKMTTRIFFPSVPLSLPGGPRGNFLARMPGERESPGREPGARTPNPEPALRGFIHNAGRSAGPGPRVEDSSAKWTGWYFTS